MDDRRAPMTSAHRSAVPWPAAPRWLVPVLAVVPLGFVTLWFLWPVTTILGRAVGEGAVADVVRNPALRAVAWFTLWQATVSTLLTLIVGLAPAWALARYRFPGHRLVRSLVLVPFVLPTVVVAAAFRALLPHGLDRGVVAILLAHVYFNVAVVVRTVGGLWEQLDPELGAAARTLGASPWRAFREVTLPLLRPAILASASIVFLFTFTSFGVVRILGGPARATIEVEIYLRAAQLGDLSGAAALALIQLVTVGALLVWWSGAQRRAAVPGLRLHAATPRRPRSTRERRVVALVVGLTVASVMLPLVALVRRSFQVGDQLSLAAWRGLGTAEIRPGVSLGLDPLGAVITSLRFAAVATAIAVVVGMLAASAIAYGGRGWRLLDAGLMLPLGTSAVTIGFGILITFDSPPVDFRSAAFLVPVVHALVATPFVVRGVLPVLRSVPSGLRDAASTLGASPWAVWRHVDAAIVSRSLVASAGLAFAVSLGEFGATSFLTRRGSETLPIAIDRMLGRTGDLLQAQAYALATILLLVTMLVVLAVDGLRPLRGDGW
jgi:thiamine transport system permease protein